MTTITQSACTMITTTSLLVSRASVCFSPERCCATVAIPLRTRINARSRSVRTQRRRRVRHLSRERVVVRVDHPTRGLVLLLAARPGRPVRRVVAVVRLLMLLAVMPRLGRWQSEELFPDGRAVDGGQQGERERDAQPAADGHDDKRRNRKQ